MKSSHVAGRNEPRRGSAESLADQVRRVVSVLAWFRTHPEASLMSTAERFNVSVPQLREELTRVQECGLPEQLPGSLIELSIHGTQVEVHNSLGINHALALTSAEAGVLELNLEKLASILTNDERKDADSAAALIHSPKTGNMGKTGSIDQKSGQQPRPDVNNPTHLEADTLTLLRRALASPRRWVQFSYLSVSSDSVIIRKVVPDHVSIINGSGYLWGRECLDDDSGSLREQRSYVVSRMQQVEILSQAAPAASPPTITEEDPFGFRESTADWAELTLTEEAMWMLEYLPLWHIDGTRVEIPDTGAWLERFLLAYAPDITAIAPAPVVNRAATRCSAALAAYRLLA